VRPSLRGIVVGLVAGTVVAARVAGAEPRPGVSALIAVGVDRSFDTHLATLRYAEQDALRVAATATATGMVAATEARTAVDVTRAEFAQLFAAPSRGGALERFVLYFSGHADDRGLHLADGVVSHDELHRLLDGVRAKTKIIFIDSCFAGAVAAKGVECAPAFALPALDLDELSGTVYLTASSAHAVAFESDELGGGVFTHFLVKGLAGLGDGNGDGLVTIDELYQFVYREMRLRAMTQPIAAEQKPEIHADLHGKGALVVAMPRGRVGQLRVDSGVMGRIEVASVSGLGTYRVETDGAAARTVALPAGAYRAVIRRGNRIGEASVSVDDRATATLLAGDFTWHDRDGAFGGVKGLTARDGAAATTTLALRSVGDGTGATGPYAQASAVLGGFEKARNTVRFVALGGVFGARGRTEDGATSAAGASVGLGLTLSASQPDTARFLVGLGEGVECQTRKTADGTTNFFHVPPYQTVMLGAEVDLGEPLQGRRSVLLRYDVDQVEDPADGRLGRRDSYVLGLSFRP
jgi:hypothetical protein